MFQHRSTANRPVAAALAALLLLAAIPATAMAAVENDERTDATPIVSLPFSAMQDTSDATSAADDPQCLGLNESNTVWYRYDPADPVDVRAHTFGSDYDTTLSVFLEDGNELIALACNDDTDGLQSEVYLSAFPGTTYWFMVGAFGEGPGGNLVLTVEEGTPPPPEWIDVAISLTSATIDRAGHVTVVGTVTCSQEAWGSIFAHLRQRVGRSYVNAFGENWFSCGPDARPLHLTSQTEDGVFAGGAIQVLAHAFVEGVNGFGSTLVDASVRGRPSR